MSSTPTPPAGGAPAPASPTPKPIGEEPAVRKARVALAVARLDKERRAAEEPDDPDLKRKPLSAAESTWWVWGVWVTLGALAFIGLVLRAVSPHLSLHPAATGVAMLVVTISLFMAGLSLRKTFPHRIVLGKSLNYLFWGMMILTVWNGTRIVYGFGGIPVDPDPRNWAWPSAVATTVSGWMTPESDAAKLAKIEADFKACAATTDAEILKACGEIRTQKIDALAGRKPPATAAVTPTTPPPTKKPGSGSKKATVKPAYCSDPAIAAQMPSTCG